MLSVRLFQMGIVEGKKEAFLVPQTSDNLVTTVHPILLFDTMLFLNLCDLSLYNLIRVYTIIRHTRSGEPESDS